MIYRPCPTCPTLRPGENPIVVSQSQACCRFCAAKAVNKKKKVKRASRRK